uniref:HMG box domain-containing protein n=1 Tax=Anopheles minimus TaxID=112268 RepID=A0A182VQC9_9DIPT
MMQNSAYGNPMLDCKSAIPQISLPHQTMDINEKDHIANNNNNSVANNNCCKPVENLDGSQRNCFQILHNVHIKTEDDREIQSPTGKPGATQPKEEIVETSENVFAVDQKDLTVSVQTDIKDVNQYLQRRPMNAFLIFCKRHRGLIKIYFDEENRAITTKLGKWWNQLTDEQKEPYQRLSKEHKNKVLDVNPNYPWCKQKVATPCTNNVSSVSSLAVVEPAADPVTTPVATISDERLEAAEALVSLSGGIKVRPLTTFKLADESDMGSLNLLCTEPGRQPLGDRAVQPEESPRCIQPVQVTPTTSGLMTAAGDVPRAARACKARRYNDFMNEMYPRAQSKRLKMLNKSPKISKQHSRAARTQTTINSTHTVDPNIAKNIIEGLEKELEAKVAELPALSIDHFFSILNEEKKRKKPQNAQPTTSSAGTAAVAVPMVPSTSTKLVGSSKRKSPKERITHHPQSSTEQRQTIIICHKPDTSDGIGHARPDLLDNRTTFH